MIRLSERGCCKAQRTAEPVQVVSSPSARAATSASTTSPPGRTTERPSKRATKVLRLTVPHWPRRSAARTPPSVAIDGYPGGHDPGTKGFLLPRVEVRRNSSMKSLAQRYLIAAIGFAAAAVWLGVGLVKGLECLLAF